MREIAGVQDERRLFGSRLDLCDGGTQRGGDIGVRRLVEPDMAIADLDEAEAAHAPAVTQGAARGLLNRHALEHAALQGPHGSSADPSHTLQEPAPIPNLLVIVLFHTPLLVTDAGSPRPRRAVPRDDR